MMRRLIFVLMIALLMLRGWMGEAMATGMALAPLQPVATITIATHAHETGAKGHFDHITAGPEVVQTVQALHDCAGDPGLDDAPHAGHAPCDACAACQACHTVALTPRSTSTHPIFSARVLPRAKAALFASADTARGQKPPIS